MKYIIANWKMNPQTRKDAEELFFGIAEKAAGLKDATAVVCPPFVYIQHLANSDKRLGVSLGAQNLFWEESGAFTGEVSASMLASAGAEYVIIGHSERRKYFNETDEAVAKKMKAALEAGLTPILCVGEWTREGKAMDEVKSFVKDQLEKALSLVADARTENKKVIIAYEPIWAISTMGSDEGPDTPDSAAEMIRFIKDILDTRYKIQNTMIYGGSMNPANAESFLRHEEIEGGLIGGASLRVESFSELLAIADAL